MAALIVIIIIDLLVVGAVLYYGLEDRSHRVPAEAVSSDDEHDSSNQGKPAQKQPAQAAAPESKQSST